ncbi:MAG: ABC transporter permease [Phycisphaerae bacterium]|nr:ABC transporter permease [Phycisphaerae bacterium]
MPAVPAVSKVGSTTYDAIAGFGDFTLFLLAAVQRLIAQPTRCLKPSLIFPQLYSVGVLSIPVVGITGAFIGMILALEGFDQFQAIGQEDRLGGVIVVSVCKQIGPVLSAVMVAGRVGGALSAELGTMRITEQLDAMRAMDADPIRILVVPRIVACVIMTPILTIFSDALGTAGAWLVTVRILGVSDVEFWHYVQHIVNLIEPMSGLVKATVFGLCIGSIACYRGFTCQPGAAGVGQAATSSFVTSFLAIIAANLVLAEFLNTIFILLVPDAPSVFG